MDYQSGHYDVIFTAGQTSVSFNISIFEDDIRDYNEMFTLIINKMLPNGVSKGSLSKATVTIVDTTGEIILKSVLHKF